MTRIKVLEGCTEESANKELYKLERDGNTIIDIVYTHHTSGHYKTYCVIKYKNEK